MKYELVLEQDRSSCDDAHSWERLCILKNYPTPFIMIPYGFRFWIRNTSIRITKDYMYIRCIKYRRLFKLIT